MSEDTPATPHPGHITLVLDVADADPDAFVPLFARLRARGVTFATLAEEREREPDWLALFCDLDNETRRGDVGAPRTVEQMAERLAFLGAEPAALFVARSGSRYVGYTLLNPPVAGEDPHVLRQGWTGVRPEFRRQGIATALKALGIAYARAHGYASMVTEPRTTNAASIAMSTRVGFRPVPAAST
jgi:RimJ/RimL family protein N-acetyltransferase